MEGVERRDEGQREGREGELKDGGRREGWERTLECREWRNVEEEEEE